MGVQHKATSLPFMPESVMSPKHMYITLYTRNPVTIGADFSAVPSV